MGSHRFLNLGCVQQFFFFFFFFFFYRVLSEQAHKQQQQQPKQQSASQFPPKWGAFQSGQVDPCFVFVLVGKPKATILLYTTILRNGQMGRYVFLGFGFPLNHSKPTGSKYLLRVAFGSKYLLRRYLDPLKNRATLQKDHPNHKRQSPGRGFGRWP